MVGGQAWTLLPRFPLLTPIRVRAIVLASLEKRVGEGTWKQSLQQGVFRSVGMGQTSLLPCLGGGDCLRSPDPFLPAALPPPSVEGGAFGPSVEEWTRTWGGDVDLQRSWLVHPWGLRGESRALCGEGLN